MTQHTINCTFDPKDSVTFSHNRFPDSFAISEQPHGVLFSRSEAHALHEWLSAELGLTTPTPASPLTASRAAAGAAKASRNQDRVA